MDKRDFFLMIAAIAAVGGRRDPRAPSRAAIGVRRTARHHAVAAARAGAASRARKCGITSRANNSMLLRVSSRRQRAELHRGQQIAEADLRLILLQLLAQGRGTAAQEHALLDHVLDGLVAGRDRALRRHHALHRGEREIARRQQHLLRHAQELVEEELDVRPRLADRDLVGLGASRSAPPSRPARTSPDSRSASRSRDTCSCSAPAPRPG